MDRLLHGTERQSGTRSHLLGQPLVPVISRTDFTFGQALWTACFTGLASVPQTPLPSDEAEELGF
jgi:hypothetical protein